MELPSFRFHPDPVRSGSITASDEVCRCCGQKRGWVYVGPVYSEADVEEVVCPWCIADGSAHEKLDVTFVDTEAVSDDVPADIVDEITQRTPGFNSFQSERWPSCCGEPGAYITPAGITEIRQHYRAMEGELMSHIVHDHGISGGAAKRMLESLHREQSPSAFVFQCRKCERFFGHIDYV
jgi:uncharacterized protein